MRYSISVAVEGRILVGRVVPVEYRGIRIEFETNGEFLSTITVSCPVDPLAFQTAAIPPTDAEPGAFHFTVDEAVRDELLAALRGFEATLGFATAGALRRLILDELSEEWIAESEEERERLHVSRLKRRSSYPPSAVRIDDRTLAMLAAEGIRRTDLLDPKAFFNQGHREYEQFHYVQAFVNFYYVLEGFLADGKSGEKEIVQRFSTNPMFLAATKRVLKGLREDPDQNHWRNLGILFREMVCEENEIGTIRLLFRMRNALHHYAPRSPKPQPSVYGQERFHSLAWLTMLLARVAILERDEFSQGLEKEGASAGS
jgi:hypothetical protein